jgi:hypothetical protein
MGLERLFDATLRFRAGMQPVVSSQEREGELVGSGDGTVHGPSIQGTMRWSNFEIVGERLCAMNPAGVITTDDGATITFGARGWALQTTARHLWSVAGSLHLHTDDRQYDQLNHALAIWEGQFDTSTGIASWHIYQPAQDQ